MTARQWTEWNVYFDHFPTQLERSDINAALTRHSILAPYTRVDALDLLPRYGKTREYKTDEEMKESCVHWAGRSPGRTE